MDPSNNGQVENAKVRKPKYKDGSTETEKQDWEENLLSVFT